MTALTARNTALADQVLAVLAGTGAMPLSTRQVAEQCTEWSESETYRALTRLAARQQAEKITLPDCRMRYWRGVIA